jgi:hypothetical protein
MTMKTKTKTVVRFTDSELAAVKEALRLLGLEMRRHIAFDTTSIEFCERSTQPGRAAKYRRQVVRAEQIAAGGRLAEAAIAKAEARG